MRRKVEVPATCATSWSVRSCTSSRCRRISRNRCLRCSGGCPSPALPGERRGTRPARFRTRPPARWRDREPLNRGAPRPPRGAGEAPGRRLQAGRRSAPPRPSRRRCRWRGEQRPQRADVEVVRPPDPWFCCCHGGRVPGHHTPGDSRCVRGVKGRRPAACSSTPVRMHTLLGTSGCAPPGRGQPTSSRMVSAYCVCHPAAASGWLRSSRWATRVAVPWPPCETTFARRPASCLVSACARMAPGVGRTNPPTKGMRPGPASPGAAASGCLGSAAGRDCGWLRSATSQVPWGAEALSGAGGGSPARLQPDPDLINRLRRQSLITSTTHRDLLDHQSGKCCVDPLRPPRSIGCWHGLGLAPAVVGMSTAPCRGSCRARRAQLRASCPA